ncbi:MAG: HepT-like ribonuclease domain-containing protein [Thermoproteus sp.]
MLDGIDAGDLGDVYKYLSAVYLLQVQALIDIAVRAAAALGLEVEGYIDAGEKLRSAGVIDDEFKRYRAVVRFRNTAVRRYGAVDAAVIARIVRNREYREAARLAVKIVEELRRRGADP